MFLGDGSYSQVIELLMDHMCGGEKAEELQDVCFKRDFIICACLRWQMKKNELWNRNEKSLDFY